MANLAQLFLLLFFAVFPLGQLLRFSGETIGLAGVIIQPLDLIMAGFNFFWIAEALFSRKKPVLGFAFFPLLWFTAVSFFSLLFSLFRLAPDQAAIAFLYWLRWLSYFFFYTGLSSLVGWRKIKTELLRRAVFLSGTVSLTYGFIQYFVWPNLNALKNIGWDPHFYRMAGSFLDTGYAGLVFVLTFWLAVWFSSRSRDHKTGFFYGLWGSLAALGVILTFSRASYAAFLVGLLVWAILWRKMATALLISFLFILGVWFVPKPIGEGGKIERVYTASARVASWQSGVKFFLEKPILGVGFNSLRSRFDDQTVLNHSAGGVDSSPLFVLATTGVLGLTAYGMFWWKIFRKAARSGLPWDGIVAASLASIIFHSLFHNTLFYPWIWSWVLLLVTTMEPRGSMDNI